MPITPPNRPVVQTITLEVMDMWKFPKLAIANIITELRERLTHARRELLQPVDQNKFRTQINTAPESQPTTLVIRIYAE